jgi:CRP/FNR family transcriptional regulator, cyclic AMP receptor protein
MNDNHERVLKASRLFASLDPAVVSDFARTASRTRYARGEYVWHAGAQATHFVIIASGLIKICRSTADGGETILALFGPRESVGDVAVLGSRPYPADAVALTDLDLVRIDGASVRGAFASNPTVLSSINMSLIEHTHALQEKIKIMTAGKIEKRLATLLLHLASRFGDENGDGTTFVPIRISRSECARLIGATDETTIRTFSRWQKAALVETTAEGFTLRDVTALTELTRS